MKAAKLIRPPFLPLLSLTLTSNTFTTSLHLEVFGSRSEEAVLNNSRDHRNTKRLPPNSLTCKTICKLLPD